MAICKYCELEMNEAEFYEVMNVFGGGVVAHEGLAGFGGVIGGDAVERRTQLRAFLRG